MISVEYVQTMARYNAWQNQAVITAAESLPPDEIGRDRGAFWGSILGTLNHLMWGDRMWMSRLAGWKVPEGPHADGARLYPTLAAWKADRMRADGRIQLWARSLRPSQLRGDLTWQTASGGAAMTVPVALCVMHMFNHQTHHRGQVHAMLTAAGAETGVTDLLVLPDRI